MAKTASGLDIELLVAELSGRGVEAEWYEFKRNNNDPNAIGEYVSALSNGAALSGRPYGYLIWGVRDDDHAIVGTDFRPAKAKKGAEDLEAWLARELTPRIWFEFREADIGGVRVVVLEVEAASGLPVAFKNIRYIRVGSYKKPLQKAPAQEKKLWWNLQEAERLSAPVRSSLAAAEVVDLLDLDAYRRVVGHPSGLDVDRRVETLQEERFVRQQADGRFEILRHGALLLARDLRDFPTLADKRVRVLEYATKVRTGDAVSDITEDRGYGASFESVFDYICQRIPLRERLDGAIRSMIPMYPLLAVRELLANALIHQDLAVPGGPMVQIFSDHLEISNPGTPLVSVTRFLDSPPLSRNEDLANFMYRAGICERRGSGIDKVIEQIESYQHPPPAFRATEAAMVVTLFDPDGFKLRKDDRVWAIYLHSCIRYVNGEHVTNESVRGRFGLVKSQSSLVSRYLRESVESGLVSQFDPDAGRKSRTYVPFWAVRR